jgi:hypothetical protein
MVLSTFAMTMIKPLLANIKKTATDVVPGETVVMSSLKCTILSQYVFISSRRLSKLNIDPFPRSDSLIRDGSRVPFNPNEGVDIFDVSP